MKENKIEIKYRNNNFLGTGFVYLALLIFSLTLIMIPSLTKTVADFKYVFYIFGAIAFSISAFLFVSFLISHSKPQNALILDKNGLRDIINTGNNVLIEWTNIASCDISGEKLNISFENSDIVMTKMRKSDAENMRIRIEEGYSPIIIKQSDIAIPLAELKSHIDSYIRNSRSVTNNPAPKKPKPKNNPFTSNDVLRAFGKLPQEEETPTAPETPEKPKNDTEDDFYMALRQIKESKRREEKPIETASETIPEEKAPELAKTIIAEEPIKPKAKAQDTDTPKKEKKPIEPIDADMPEEIKKILAEAHSEKISQLGKILSEKTVPYSYEKELLRDKKEASAAETKDDTSLPEKKKPTEDIPSPEQLTITEVISDIPDDNEILSQTEITLEATDDSEAEDTERLNLKDIESDKKDNGQDKDEEFPEFVVIDENDYPLPGSDKTDDSDEDDNGFVIIDF